MDIPTGRPIRRRELLALGGFSLGGLTLASLAIRGQPGAQASGLPPLPPRGDVRLVVISDLNSAYGSTTYIAEVHRGIGLIPRLQADLVVCAGDMIAAQKLGLGSARLAEMWAAFDRQILSPIRTADLPFAFTFGNHDASSSRSQGRFTFAEDREAAARFWSPRRSALGLNLVGPGGFPFHYCVLQNGIFLLVWDASSAVVPPDQLAWAERSLASDAARSARARVVLGHLPLHGVGRGRDRPGEILHHSTALQQLMERHHVSTCISGHQHAYFPGRLGSLDLLHCGALGSGPRPLLQGNAGAFQTLTVLDLESSSGRFRNTTLDMRTLQTVSSERLPREIVSSTARIRRQDLAMATADHGRAVKV